MLNVFWFRKDLRLIDNRALSEFIDAVSSENKFSFLYIKNRNTFNYFGEKRISFLIECLAELEEALKEFSFELQITEGNSVEFFRKLLDEHKQISLFVNEQIEPYCTGRDEKIREMVEGNGGIYNSFSDTTLFKLGEVRSEDGSQYKVFTPFKNRALKNLRPEHYKKQLCDLSKLRKSNEVILKCCKKSDLKNDYEKLEKSSLLKGGRINGIKVLKEFYGNGMDKYIESRDFPSEKGTSLLSAHIHFGTVSIREAFRTAIVRLEKENSTSKKISVQKWIDGLL